MGVYKPGLEALPCFCRAVLNFEIDSSELTEAFLDGHVSAFAFLGGVTQGILYDNTKLAVAKILGDGRRQRTRAFTVLQSQYLFEDRFGRSGKGNPESTDRRREDSGRWVKKLQT